MMNDEITPPNLFFNRRKWLQAAGLLGAIPVTASVYRAFNPVDFGVKLERPIENWAETSADFSTNEWPTTLYEITHYNNFLEFSSEKEDVVTLAKDFTTDSWTIQIDGLVENPITLSIDEIRKRFPIEERIYRMRCVEAWSMVIPWAGFPLSSLLELVRPTAEAKFVAFESLKDRSRMPNQVFGPLEWPYREGLRLDEAMHPLTILATGLYRRDLPPQDGAPIRLVVPWKYGYKSIKSIVKISLVAEQPLSTWNQSAAHEYGFYANVNPQVDHPRWSQAHERRIGDLLRRPTMLFNGYEKQVSHLYKGMDLSVHF